MKLKMVAGQFLWFEERLHLVDKDDVERVSRSHRPQHTHHDVDTETTHPLMFNLYRDQDKD